MDNFGLGATGFDRGLLDLWMHVGLTLGSSLKNTEKHKC